MIALEVFVEVVEQAARQLLVLLARLAQLLQRERRVDAYGVGAGQVVGDAAAAEQIARRKLGAIAHLSGVDDDARIGGKDVEERNAGKREFADLDEFDVLASHRRHRTRQAQRNRKLRVVSEVRQQRGVDGQRMFHIVAVDPRNFHQIDKRTCDARPDLFEEDAIFERLAFEEISVKLLRIEHGQQQAHPIPTGRVEIILVIVARPGQLEADR